MTTNAIDAHIRRQWGDTGWCRAELAAWHVAKLEAEAARLEADNELWLKETLFVADHDVAAASQMYEGLKKQIALTRQTLAAALAAHRALWADLNQFAQVTELLAEERTASPAECN